jgi:hypothetical protein
MCTLTKGIAGFALFMLGGLVALALSEKPPIVAIFGVVVLFVCIWLGRRVWESITDC